MKIINFFFFFFFSFLKQKWAQIDGWCKDVVKISLTSWIKITYKKKKFYDKIVVRHYQENIVFADCDDQPTCTLYHS